MELQVPALLLTLLIYLLLGIEFLGWGTASAALLGIDTEAKGSWAEAVWLGFASTLLMLQLIHLILPLTAFAVIPLFVLGFVFGIRSITIGLRHRPRELTTPKSWAALAAVILLVAGWIAMRSITQPPDNYDSGLYHFNAIRWIFSYPIVPGLGNLHGRLAFNSSFFALVAALDVHPFLQHGHQIANSFLLVLAFATAADFLRPLAGEPSQLAATHPFHYGAPLFALPPLAYLALSASLSSPTPDVTSTILQFVLFIFVCDGIGKWRSGQLRQDYRATLVLMLSVTAVTIKLTNLAFASAIAAFVAAYSLHRPRRSSGEFARIILPATVLALVWSIRGFLLSGAPLYPSAIGYIPVEWAVPKEAVIEEAKWVYSWARNPGAHWSSVLGNWAWLRPWLVDRSNDFLGVAYPLQLSALLCIMTGAVLFGSKRHQVGPLEWVILTPPIAGLAYWFLTAPNMRFVNALFFLLSLSSCLLLLLSVQALVRPAAYAAILCVLFIAGNFHFLRYAVRNKWTLKPCATVGSWVACIPSASWRPIPEVPLTTHTTSSGLDVFTPSTGDQCWDAPLPCTPYFNLTLRLREPGVLSSGFTLAAP